MKTYFLIMLLFMNTFVFAEINYETTEYQNTLLELYTSEGCSSCPPADDYLNELSSHPELWKSVVPIAFHVDYWDYLGWKDSFAKPDHTLRQRKYARMWNSRTIYTPGFVKNGKEVRSWRSKDLLSSNRDKVGKLKVRIGEKMCKVSFFPVELADKDYDVHTVIIGNEIISKVKRGENSGRTLKHNFTVLNHTVHKMTKYNSENWQVTIHDLTIPTNTLAKSYSIATWVTSKNSLVPIQVIGGNIKKDSFARN